MTKQIRCEECGAPMQPHADGRRYACSHCGAERQVAIDTEQLAEGLRLDLSNVDSFLRDLSRSPPGRPVPEVSVRPPRLPGRDRRHDGRGVGVRRIRGIGPPIVEFRALGTAIAPLAAGDPRRSPPHPRPKLVVPLDR